MTASAIRLVFAALLSLFAHAGCATSPAQLPWSRGSATPDLPGTFVDARTGQALTDATVYARLGAADVVFIAEQHGERAHHGLQAALSLALSRYHGGRVVAAIEWLPVSSRGALAGWLDGLETPARLRQQVLWDTVWGHAFEAYVPFFEVLRAGGVPIEPINAEQGLARAIARGEPLDAAQKALLPPLDSGTPAHRAWFEQQMTEMGAGHHGHAFTPERMAQLYQAQLVWDETMAQNVMKLLENHACVVVCAGSGHITRALGIPGRVGQVASVLVMPLTDLEDARTRAVEGPFPTREADLFWVP